MQKLSYNSLGKMGSVGIKDVHFHMPLEKLINND